MKYRKSLLAVSLLLSLNSFNAQASLVDRGNGMIYDTDLNITWVADANLFKTQLDSNSNLVATIISDVGTFDGHNLTSSDFNTSNGALSWWGALAWAANLNYSGYSDWRLPSAPNTTGAIYNQTNSEMGHLFYNELGGSAHSFITTNHNVNYNLFNNVQAYDYWTGAENVSINKGCYFFTDGGGQGCNGDKDWQFFAWAVRDGDVAPVPLPSATWLFVSALFGFMGWKRRGDIN